MTPRKALHAGLFVIWGVGGVSFPLNPRFVFLVTPLVPASSFVSAGLHWALPQCGNLTQSVLLTMLVRNWKIPLEKICGETSIKPIYGSHLFICIPNLQQMDIRSITVELHPEESLPACSLSVIWFDTSSPSFIPLMLSSFHKYRSYFLFTYWWKMFRNCLRKICVSLCQGKLTFIFIL